MARGPFVLLALLPAATMAVAEPKAEDPARKDTARSGTEEGDGEREPLWEAELQLGYGVSSQSSAEMSHTATGPMSFAALAAIAINEEPRAYAVGGLVGEAIDRYGIGVTAGARIAVPSTPVRVTGAGVWMVAPKTLWGASAAAGACWGRGALGLCGDVQLTAYFAGTGLPKDELELQVAFVIGVVARGGM